MDPLSSPRRAERLQDRFGGMQSSPSCDVPIGALCSKCERSREECVINWHAIKVRTERVGEVIESLERQLEAKGKQVFAMRCVDLLPVARAFIRQDVMHCPAVPCRCVCKA